MGPTWSWAPHHGGTCSLQTAVVRGGGGGPHRVGGPVHYKLQWLGGEGVGPTRWWGTCSLQTAVVRRGGPTRWGGTCALQTAVVRRGEGVGPTRWGTCSLQTAVVRRGEGVGPTRWGTCSLQTTGLGGVVVGPTR